MTKEDYFKYYIQGSDHYLIPKDIFDELFNEMSNWREEAKELKKQLEESDFKIANLTMDKIELKKQLEEKENVACNWKDSCLENAGKIEKLENQQKEFIDYLTSYIELLNNKPDLIEEGQQDILKEVFDKFKEIIGE